MNKLLSYHLEWLLNIIIIISLYPTDSYYFINDLIDLMSVSNFQYHLKTITHAVTLFILKKETFQKVLFVCTWMANEFEVHTS